MTLLKRQDLVYPELSYKIVGVLFDVCNELGAGHQEKYYQKAVAKALNEANVKFKEQVKVPLKYRKENVGIYFLDFLIEDKMILEIKRGDRFSKDFYHQVNAYLEASGLKLGLLANFTNNGVKFKRVVNVTNS